MKAFLRYPYDDHDYHVLYVTVTVTLDALMLEEEETISHDELTYSSILSTSLLSFSPTSIRSNGSVILNMSSPHMVVDPPPSTSTVDKKKPVCIITIGMAGAGKSTFVQRINSYLHSSDPNKPPYILNLDPAVAFVPYEANIDIRDTVNYPEVMKQ